MRHPRRSFAAGIGMLAALLVAWAAVLAGGAQETGAAAGAEWPMYRGDPAGTGYSTLAQVTVDNAAHLVRAWTYSLRAATPAAPPAGGAAARGPRSQATPIVVDGVMYVPAADRVVALDPATGRELWRHVVAGGAPSRRAGIRAI